MEAALVFSGTNIRNRDDLLCLTDMWRAAGGDESKRPAEWLRQEGPQEFVRFIADNLNMGIDHIIIGERGKDGGTWAHWQIGVAYAKYLSPELHAYVNQVFRNHMELAARTSPSIEAFGGLIRRELEPVHEELREQRHEQKAFRGELNAIRKILEFPSSRRDMKAEDRRVHAGLIQHHYYGRCPCLLDCEVLILTDGEILPNWHEHHQFSKSENGLYQMIPLNRECHERITRDAAARTRFAKDGWLHYQTLLARLPMRQLSMPV
jgi:hypothetical protein